MCDCNLSFGCFQILHNFIFFAVFPNISCQLNLSVPNLTCTKVKPSAFQYLTDLSSSAPLPLHPSHPSCVRNTFHPATPFPHFILHMFANLFLYLSPLVSPLPSLHLAYLSAALLAQWQSHHTLSIRLVRTGRSAAQHRTALVWSHQCQSVSLTLSVTWKRFRLPDIVCFPHPLYPSCCRSGDGRDRAGVKIQRNAWFDTSWHIIWPVLALKTSNSSFKQRPIYGHMLNSNPWLRDLKT